MTRKKNVRKKRFQFVTRENQLFQQKVAGGNCRFFASNYFTSNFKIYFLSFKMDKKADLLFTICIDWLLWKKQMTKFRLLMRIFFLFLIQTCCSSKMGITAAIRVRIQNQISLQNKVFGRCVILLWSCRWDSKFTTRSCWEKLNRNLKMFVGYLLLRL